MPTPSIYQSTGLTVQPYPPLWSASRYHFQSFTSQIKSYSHNLSLDGGLYTSADIGLALYEEEAVDWIEYGLGRHIVVKDSLGGTVFEGFINTIRVSFGNLTLTYGPVMDVANRVKVQYTPYIDVAVDPPVTGTTTETIYAQDTASQLKYGIHEVVVDGGTLIDSMTYIGGGTPDHEAELIRDAYLAEFKNAEISHSVGFERAEFEVKLELKGYSAFFEKHIYNSANLLTVQVPTKLQNVVDANPNTAIFSTDYSDISTDATYLQLTSAFEDKNRTASAIIKELLSLGNSTNNRTIFLIRQDRKAYYSAIPTTPEYYYDTNLNTTVDELGAEVLPWRIMPGKWVEFIGLRGVSQISAMRDTFRHMFIETVNYTAPYDIQLGGNKVSKISQILAKKGVS